MSKDGVWIHHGISAIQEHYYYTSLLLIMNNVYYITQWTLYGSTFDLAAVVVPLQDDVYFQTLHLPKEKCNALLQVKP